MADNTTKPFEDQIRLVRNRIATVESGLFRPNPALLAKDRALLAKLEEELEELRNADRT